jgi:hypothetical protein
VRDDAGGKLAQEPVAGVVETVELGVLAHRRPPGLPANGGLSPAKPTPKRDRGVNVERFMSVAE